MATDYIVSDPVVAEGVNIEKYNSSKFRQNRLLYSNRIYAYLAKIKKFRETSSGFGHCFLFPTTYVSGEFVNDNLLFKASDFPVTC